ncbi:hypothetical protein E4U43_006798 [Claviceps pusilla]|uniref:Uncharacterized protein n=1 Tax=Claviceps pusilla TaxID=123648 RepID=A0A9P7NDN9_9HYPO|nr:hypothetical protein E4U43_006798 [Claviceps pusilla]
MAICPSTTPPFAPRELASAQQEDPPRFEQSQCSAGRRADTPANTFKCDVGPRWTILPLPTRYTTHVLSPNWVEDVIREPMATVFKVPIVSGVRTATSDQAIRINEPEDMRRGQE